MSAKMSYLLLDVLVHVYVTSVQKTTTDKTNQMRLRIQSKSVIIFPENRTDLKRNR